MILKIVKYPEPILSQPGEPVTEFNAELRKLVADMFETTYANQGMSGWLRQQVGVSKRVTVIDVSMGKDPKDNGLCSSIRRLFSAKASCMKKKAA
jgi:peptide deformylase